MAQTSRRAGLAGDWPGYGLAIVLGGTLAIAAAGVLAPAFGFLPTLGGTELSLDPFVRFFTAPGIFRAMGQSLYVGLSATFLAVILTHSTLAAFYTSRWFAPLAWQSRLILVAPHVAIALSIAFLFTPSGLMMRWLSPWATGWTSPPDYLFPQDPWGLALIAGLAVKEFPFLLGLAIAQLGPINPRPALHAAASMGYGPLRAFTLVVTPQLATRLRFPVYVALAYAISSVDQALVLGSSPAPILSVRLLQWFNDSDLGARFPLAAGALVLVALTALGFAIWWLGEKGFAAFIHYGAASGRRTGPVDGAMRTGAGLGVLTLTLTTTGLFGLGLNAFASHWRFPDDWPGGFSLDIFGGALSAIAPAAGTSAGLALASAVVSTLWVLAALEASHNHRRLAVTLHALMFVPLVIPDISLMFGLSGFWAALRLDGHWLTVLWAHLLFTIPYCWLIVAGPFRNFNEGLVISARLLGAGRWGAFFRVKIPGLAAPILAGFGIAALVSASLYLPTLLAGGGRITTLATESIALSQSGDRRLLGALALAMMVLPLIAVEGSALAPKWLLRNRSGLNGATA